MNKPSTDKNKRESLLLSQVPTPTSLPSEGEDVWIEVIQQMDRVYAELIESQVALEAKNAELQGAHKFIESVMGSMSDILIVCDTDGNIQQVNDALERSTGRTAKILIGQPLAQILTGCDTDTQARFREHLSANESFSDYEVQISDLNDDLVPLSVNCSPRHDNKGNTVGLVLIGRPVGELQRAYQELDAALENFAQAQQHLVGAEKMASLGRLVAGVAHELNNPISFVFGNMYALKSYGEKIIRYLKVIDSNASQEEMARMRAELQIDRIADDILPLVEGTMEGAERVRDIVQELRQFSGSQTEPPKEFRVKPTIETAVNWVMRGARHQPIVVIECASGLKICSKKGHLHQILVNLVQNAIDALEDCKEARITITCEQQNRGIIIKVADNGKGIAAEDIDQIFEPFFTTKPVGEGTGLGLYVSYRMADEIGAKLGVNNSTHGTEMIISLPTALPEIRG